MQNDIRIIEDSENLNTRLVFRKNLWKNKLQLNSLFETQGGTFAQQEYTYVEVEEGVGVYIWNDYNGDGLQSFDEFEVSVFQDEATYVRVLLPNQIYSDTYQNKYSQQLGINFSSWKDSKKTFLRLASHFYNQTSYLIDRKSLKENNNLKLNVFKDSDTDVGLNSSFRNSLFFNRGKQNFSATYNFVDSKLNSLLITGLQTRNFKSHEFILSHKIKESWLLGLNAVEEESLSATEGVVSQNYKIEGQTLNPRLSYLFNEQSNFYLEYSYVDKKNTIGDEESLIQKQLGLGFRISGAEKGTLTGGFDWFENNFQGSSFSSVGYQLLEGLNSGTNFTWKLLVQKKITKFLELNLDYLGRKSEDSKATHTGSIQLRAFF